MNTKEILDDIDAALDHFPESEKYKKSKLRVVNTNYLELSELHPWPWLQKRSALHLYTDVTGSGAAEEIVATAGEHKVLGGLGTAFAAHYEGQIFVFPDGQETRVVAVAGTHELYVEDRVATTVSDDGWSIEFRNFPLPADCAEPLGIVDRVNDGGRFVFVDAREEENYPLSRDSTGDSVVYIEDTQSNDRPPERPIGAAAVSTGVQQLLPNTEYEYCYTIVAFGRESPPSVVTRQKTSAPARHIELVGMEDLRDDGVLTGRAKRIYRRIVKPSTRWLRLVTLSEATTTYGDSGAIEPSREEPNVLYDQDRRQYMRPWYTPSADATVELRYLQRPRRLQSDQDVPSWPSAYHQLLVYKSLETICLRHGMTTNATLYSKLAEKVLARMQMKLVRTDKTYRMKGFDRTSQRENWSAPSKTDA